MDLATLMDIIRATPSCSLYPASGLPVLAQEHRLPDDLCQFYELCGGCALFEEADYAISIVRPQGFLLANPVIILSLNEEDRLTTKDDPSWNWYIVAEAFGRQYITIDLDSERYGNCYDSFWEIHPGNSPVIASSFTDFLHQLVESRGAYWYWLQQEFKLT